MFCNNCGEKVAEGIAKCPKCGEIIMSKSNLEQITENTAQATAAAKETFDFAFDVGCFGVLLMFLNPLYWAGRDYLERARDAASKGDIDLSNAMLKKGKKYSVLAMVTSVLFIVLVIVVVIVVAVHC